ncbi:zinc finger protein 208-like isoform X2 [Lutzomyia longipalpis]|uniref:zinc finger protein 208-like isoform X2 n=1 Tax=Lutzomyia longipalpis TaxID=7200 RepID=UPI0024843CB6|nr:zinc finger protein 208-like isoform X2 [Lutzomyia longipalpis]
MNNSPEIEIVCIKEEKEFLEFVAIDSKDNKNLLEAKEHEATVLEGSLEDCKEILQQEESGKNIVKEEIDEKIESTPLQNFENPETTLEDKPMKIFNENFGVANILGSCSICNQKYLKSELERHIAMHGKKKRHRERRLICEFCGKFFANISRMEQHKIIHTTDRSYRCEAEGCCKTFKWRTSYEKHKMRHKENAGKKFKCDLCEKTFRYSYILRHVLDVHEPPQVLKCKCCEKTFTRKESLHNHMKLHQGIILTDEEKISRGLKDCDQCGKSCLLIHFDKHMMSHRGERPLKCEICGKGFIWKCGLKKHLMAHRGELSKTNLPICEVCGKKMSKFQSLQAHMKIHERPTMPFKCSVTGCDKSYSNEKFLKRHINRHNSKRHKCNECEVDYKDSQQLKIHVKKIHLKEEAPFKCVQCNKDSWTRRVHRQHMKKYHNIEIPFVRKKE